ncbi:hypothetical protein U1Q18_022200, partial [Sarracenia purpurea var. burkii]
MQLLALFSLMLVYWGTPWCSGTSTLELCSGFGAQVGASISSGLGCFWVFSLSPSALVGSRMMSLQGDGEGGEAGFVGYCWVG